MTGIFRNNTKISEIRLVERGIRLQRNPMKSYEMNFIRLIISFIKCRLPERGREMAGNGTFTHELYCLPNASLNRRINILNAPDIGFDRRLLLLEAFWIGQIDIRIDTIACLCAHWCIVHPNRKILFDLDYLLMPAFAAIASASKLQAMLLNI